MWYETFGCTSASSSNKDILNVAQFWPPSYPSYRRPVWRVWPPYSKSVLEKSRKRVLVFFFLFTAVHCSRGMWKNGLSQVVGCECALQKEISLTETSAVACTACSSINHKLMYLMDAWKKKEKKRKDGHALTSLRWKLRNVYPFRKWHSQM